MRHFFRFVVPFFIKTALMLFTWTLILFFCVLIGVENVWETILSGGDLADILDVQQYLSPEALILNTTQAIPIFDVVMQMFGTISAGRGIELTAHIDMEICKAAALAAVMYVCGYCQRMVEKVSDGLCSLLDRYGIVRKVGWADLATSLFCHVYTIFISVSAVNILVLRFRSDMPFYGKALPFVCMILIACLPFVIGGRKSIRTILLRFFLGPIACILAAICAILFIAMLELIVYEGAMELSYYVMALVFLLSSSVLVYLATKEMLAESKQKAMRFLKKP